MPLIPIPALTFGCDSAVAGQMPPGGPSGHHDPACVAAERRQLFAKKVERAMNFGNDLVERRLRRQRVADQRDIDAMRHRSRGKQGKNFLGAMLPIAAVDKYHRRPVFRHFAKIDPPALSPAISVYEITAIWCSHPC